MKYILVFTKPASLNSVNGSFSNRKDIKQLSLTNAVLQFDEETGSFNVCERLGTEGLYVVFDGIAEEEFWTLLSGKDKECIYVLKHTKPEFEFTIPQSQLAEGRHANAGEHYAATVKILVDKEGEKVRRVFEAVFKTDPILESKLAILQRILSGETEIRVDARLKSQQADIDTFFVTAGGKDIFAPEYQRAFRCLRSAIGIE